MESSIDYKQLAVSSHLSEAEGTWSVVVADIKGSTQAVLDGKYREVNLIGAACIAAIRNEFKPREILYVFGGDGATFLVPPEKLDLTLQLLNNVKDISESEMNLHLRVGFITVAEIKKLGGEIYYGFLELSQHECFAYFRGNGIAIAEKEIKRRAASETKEKIQTSKDNQANLRGLSCRVLPFNAQRGEILSIIIEPRLYGSVQDVLLEKIFKALQGDGNLLRINPINLKSYKRTISIKKCISEAKLMKKGNGFIDFFKSFMNIILGSIVSYFMFRFNISSSGLGSPKDYDKALVHQSDWIKMDGVLRLVIDVNKDEKEAFLGMLKEMQRKEEIYFGYHASSSAVIVCHYQSGIDDRHLHFVDGIKGGLTKAATNLVETRHALSPSNTRK